MQKSHSIKSIMRRNPIGKFYFCLQPIYSLKTKFYHVLEVLENEGEEVFIFLDSLYYSATKSALYGKNGNLHKGFDHERFAETMKNFPHKWLITYDNSDYIKDMFSSICSPNEKLIIER